MNTADFIRNLEEVNNFHDLAPVVGINVATGETFTILGVKAETHDDADGSTTIWVELEEN